MENVIENFEFYDYRPAISENFNETGSEFAITAHNEDIVTQPSKSLLVINGTLNISKYVMVTEEAGEAAVSRLQPVTENDLENFHFINNGLLHIFDRIDYYIGDVKIDTIRKPGIATTMKGLSSFEDDTQYNDAGWKITNTSPHNILNKDGHFSVTIPLSIIMGFFEDYKQFLYHMPQKLVFYRNTGTHINSVYVTPSTERYQVGLTLKEIAWRIPQIKFSIEYETQIRKDILDNTNYEMLYRHWFYQSISPPAFATEFTWDFPVSYSKTKYILLAFQQLDTNSIHTDNSQFNLLDLENIQVLLNNNIYYPRERLNLKFSEHKCGRLYYMFKQFKASYYANNSNNLKPLIDYYTFLTKYPIIVIDCSHQPNLIKESLINIKIIFNWRTALSSATTNIHCLMIADRKAIYNPLNNQVIGQ